MCATRTRLHHTLSPAHYFSDEQYRAELESIFFPSWQWVGNVADLSNDGDFLTHELWRKPILLRNFDGQIGSFLNVCPHRHSMLTHQAKGNQPTLKCQYHGWEFGSDGRSRRIPGAKWFRPLRDGPECLQVIDHAVAGPLLFASTDARGSDLREQLGSFITVLEEFESRHWIHHATWNYRFDANWKVVVENTIESYHLDTVHPHSFRFEPEEDIVHRTYPFGGEMRATTGSHPLWDRIANAVSAHLCPGSSLTYRLHHVYPNLFLIRIGVILQVMEVRPVSPSACHARVSLFVLNKYHGNPVSRTVTRLWGTVMLRAIKRILSEDARLYADIQRGLTHSPHRGVLSSREELVHAFQHYVSQATR